ncbi:MAG TPA: Ig-like domain-containing protein [Longimicrobiaceae bacterium]|nr:Ig-like domain-containing protein [Longimicrobiaceae bacterium]
MRNDLLLSVREARERIAAPALLLVLGLAACGDGPTQARDDTDPYVLRIESTPMAMRQGDSASVRVGVQSRSGRALPGTRVEWTTSDESVAGVTAEGRVIGVGRGEAYVRARHGALADSVLVRVSIRWRSVGIYSMGGSSCALAWQGKVYCTGTVTAPGIGATPPTYSTSWDSVRSGPRVASFGPTAPPSGCGLTAAGKLVCWGHRLGTSPAVVEDQVFELAPPVQLARLYPGGNVMCGLSAAGEAYCWGDGSSGTLGTGSWAAAQQPSAVAGGLRFTGLSIGAATACGVTTERRAYCWGWNGYGQTGRADSSYYGRPARLPLDVEFRSVAVGHLRACGIDTSDRLWCWGGTSDRRPTVLATAHPFERIFAGAGHMCGLTASGEAFCWGSNSWGELGDGTHVPRRTPVAVTDNIRFKHLALGWSHTCGITLADELYCWGSNSNGQLGTGDRRSTAVPVRVREPAA